MKRNTIDGWLMAGLVLFATLVGLLVFLAGSPARCDDADCGGSCLRTFECKSGCECYTMQGMARGLCVEK